MNDKMLRLARLAGLRKDDSSDREYIGDFDWRLFGTLVVKECGSMMIELEPVYPANLTVRVIKDHFGV